MHWTLLPCNNLHFDQKYFQIHLEFQLKGIWKATVVWSLTIHGFIHHSPKCIYSHIHIKQFFLFQDALGDYCESVWNFWVSIIYDYINMLIHKPHSGWGRLKMPTLSMVVIINWQQVNYNYKYCIWQHLKITYHISVWVHTDIGYWSFLGMPALLL